VVIYHFFVDDAGTVQICLYCQDDIFSDLSNEAFGELCYNIDNYSNVGMYVINGIV